MSFESKPEILNSWKEVAVYLGHGVRTVQRWEQKFGLPVRRPRHRARSAVIALRSELDIWVHRWQFGGPPAEIVEPAKNSYRRGESTILIGKTHELITRSHTLTDRSRSLCAEINRRIAISAGILTRKEDHKSKASAGS